MLAAATLKAAADDCSVDAAGLDSAAESVALASHFVQTRPIWRSSWKW